MSAQLVARLETWGSKVAVIRLPRRCDQQTRTFSSAAEALAYADELRRLHGYAVRDERR